MLTTHLIPGKQMRRGRENTYVARGPVSATATTAQVALGVTLLELILSLALSIVVFTAITIAIQTYMAGLTNQQIKIERKQIARASLAMMSNDCRAALQHKAADYSGLDNLLKSQQMMASDAMSQLDGLTGGGPAAGTGAGEENKNEQGDLEDDAGTGSNPTGGSGSPTGGSSSGGAGSSGSESQTEEEPAPLYDESLVSFRPILIGTQSALMMDISRVPRLDQYSPLIASAASLSQSPADIKSIAYFFSDADGGVKSEIELETAAKGGLYRREIDRSVAAYSGEERALTSPDKNTKLVSPEVAEVEFRYFDGSDWTTSWNSEDNGGFPSAIEITIVIDPARTSRNNLTYSYRGFDKESMEMFRTVVHLPMSEPTAQTP